MYEGISVHLSASDIRRWGDGVMGRWGDGAMGQWGDGAMWRWGDGAMGRWGDGTMGDGAINEINVINIPL